MIFVLGFNLLLFFFRVLYVLYSPLDLTPEEAQYWDWSRHIDLSYYSKPPIVAYTNFLSTTLLGNSELTIRITPIVLSSLLSIFTFSFVRRLFEEKVALIASTLPQLSVGLAINSLLMTTDVLLIFFWSLSLMTFWHAMEKNTVLWWLLLGLFSGFAFLSKYSAVFLLPLALLYLSIYRRDLLWSAKTYISLIPPIFMSLPVLYWNYQHHFVSFKHVSTLATKHADLFNIATFLEFLGGQLLLVSIIPFFFMLKGWLFGWKDARLGFLAVFSLPILLFFLLLSLKKHVEANWSGFAYFGGFLLASYYLSRSRFLYPAYALSIVLFLLLHFSPLLDRIGLTNLLPPKRDPVKVAVGWEILGKEVSKIYTGQEIILSPHYQISAELAFYTKGNPRTYCINLGRRMNQYDLWRATMKDHIGKDGIYVDYSPINSRVLEGFDGIIEHRILPIPWRGEVIREFHIYKLKNYKNTIKEEEMFEGY